MVALKSGNASPTAANAVFTEIDKLDKSRSEIENEMAMAATRSASLSAPEIYFFLQRLRDGDINDLKYRRLLITVLVNAVYLYDDHLTIIFNASDNPLEITEQLVCDVESNAKEFVYEKECSTILEVSEPLVGSGISLFSGDVDFTKFLVFFHHQPYTVQTRNRNERYPVHVRYASG